MGGRTSTRYLRIAQDARANDMLRTWGEIAGLLKVSVRTAQSYQLIGLPVFKSGSSRTAAVVASRREILDWLAKKCHRTRVA